MAPPSAETFQKPPQPPATRCTLCREPMAAYWLEPTFRKSDGALFAGGKWLAPDDPCAACVEKVDQERREGALKARVRDLTAAAGFAALHEKMRIDNLTGDIQPALASAIHDATYTGQNLYLWSKTPGNGKTHVAAGLLRRAIESTGQPGFFRVVPELFVELRAAVRNRTADAVIDQLSAAGALVLDDLGTETVTEFVIERLYLLINRWASAEKKRLVITSNLSPHELGERLHERLASRLVGMCRVIEVTGPDHRLQQARQRREERNNA